MTRRSWGHIRQLRSGRYQASWLDKSGTRHLAPDTFRTKAAAERWLELERDAAEVPTKTTKRKELLSSVAYAWVNGRVLAPRTREMYQWLIEKYLCPDLDLPVDEITADTVAMWYIKKHDKAPVITAKAYRLLRAIYADLARADVIMQSPCRIPRAGNEPRREQILIEPPVIDILVEALPDRLRIVPVLASWGALRLGEIRGLQRGDINIDAGTITIQRTITTGCAGTHYIGAPKSAAGWRIVTLPPRAVEALRLHLETYVPQQPDAWVVSSGDEALTRDTWQRAWNAARKKAKKPEIRLHDLRHAGLTWAARTGATTAELMRRAGHSSWNAALRYQHANAERDQEIARGLGEMEKEYNKNNNRTYVARRKRGK